MRLTRRRILGLVGAAGASGVAAVALAIAGVGDSGDSGGEAGSPGEATPGPGGRGGERSTATGPATATGTSGATGTPTETTTETPSIDPPEVEFRTEYDYANWSVLFRSDAESLTPGNTDSLEFRVDTSLGGRIQYWYPRESTVDMSVPVSRAETVEVVWVAPNRDRTAVLATVDPAAVAEDVPTPYAAVRASYDPDAGSATLTYDGGASYAYRRVERVDAVATGERPLRLGSLSPPLARGDATTVPLDRGEAVGLEVAAVSREKYAVHVPLPDGLGRYTAGEGWGETPPAADWTVSRRSGGDDGGGGADGRDGNGADGTDDDGRGTVLVRHDGGDDFGGETTRQVAVFVDGRPAAAFDRPIDPGTELRVPAGPRERVEVVWTHRRRHSVVLARDEGRQ